MKRKHWMTVGCLFSCLLLCCACTDIPQSESEDASSLGIDAPAATEQTAEESAVQTEASTPDAEESSESEAETSIAPSASETDSSEAEETSTTASSSDAEVGSTGLTASEWCAKAQQLYESAASTYFPYLCSSDGFSYDQTDTLEGEEGWYRVTDVDTIEEAEAGYFAVFAPSQHGSDLDGQFQEQDGKVYRLCGDRGADITYASSTVTALTDSTDSTLTFSVVTDYADTETGEASSQTDTFTLVYENDSWLVGQFTMPY